MNRDAPADGKFNYIFGLINLAVIFCLVWFLWYIFMHPNGVMKLYTPMYGFALVAMLLCSIVLLSNVLDIRRPQDLPDGGMNFVVRGIILCVVSVILALFITYGVFWNFIGKFGIAYFSPEAIVVSGGTGAEPYVARENACTAIIYFGTAFLWVALAWDQGFGSWPWLKVSHGVRAWSKLLAVMLFSILIYVILFHPHVCHLFYPPQNKAGVSPWWASFAGTGSAFFSLGLLLCALSWVIMSETLWEGYPWKLLEKDGEGNLLKGIVSILVTLGLGIISFVIMLKIMNHYWMEPFEGGQYTDAPYYRYLHAGEVSGFFIIATFILSTYFNNFPNIDSLWLRSIIRTLIVIVGGFLIHWFYYSSVSTYVLGKVPGFGQPDDTPLVWTILFLAIVMMQSEFFGGLPLKRVK